MVWSISFILLLYSFPLAGQTLPVKDGTAFLQDNPADSLTVEDLLELVDEFEFTDPEKAKAYAQKAVKAAEESGNKIDEIKGLYKLSWLYIDQGNRSTAKPYFEDGLEKAKKIDNQFLTAEGNYLQSYF
ncbi:MAG: hypothetical protein ACOC4S_02525, partial [Balneolaceae bacterium]